MKTYESHIAKVAADASAIYVVVSDLRNLERVRDLIPQDKVQEFETDVDFIRLKVDGLGQKIIIRIVDRIENDTVKFGIENLPVEGNFWIQVKQVAPHDSRIKLTLKAELPVMIAMMAGNKIQEGIDQAADMMAQMPFEQWV
ncbi:MAG: SRPBCC family protein [Paludibacteraceae bacterium]|nr:SRPBCC family protein [Paludibacteraceae bacterium]